LDSDHFGRISRWAGLLGGGSDCLLGEGHTEMSRSCRIGHKVREGDYMCQKCGRMNKGGEDRLSEPCVSLKWATPDGDKMIAHMARVSNPKATPDDPAEKLISYLLRHHHWSPFEMASMCVEINTTRDITAQILRHRSFSFQEFSTRYADVEELEDFRECRFQDDKNRQNSFEVQPGTVGAQDAAWWDAEVKWLAEHAGNVYAAARERGIAKEVARCILPIGLIPSKLYMTGTVRSWLHYCAERMKPGVQKEHREVAEACWRILGQQFPMVRNAALLTEMFDK
jgi:thymidylate synthase (FAD)